MLLPEPWVWPGGRGGTRGKKISRGAPLEAQNGTQQDVNKMVDKVKFGGGGGGQKYRPGPENGGQYRGAKPA